MMRTDNRHHIASLLAASNGKASIVEALETAAELVQHAAYEYVRQEGQSSVTELILTAARLERIAQEILKGDIARK